MKILIIGGPYGNKSFGPSLVQQYRFAYRMPLDDADSLNLSAFKAIDSSLACQVGVKSPAYPIFIND